MPSSFLGTTANSFAVLGGATVTNTGPTIIDGHLGVSPGSAIVGFLPGIVTPPGTIHAANAIALQAQVEVTTAYVTLAGLPSDADLTGQDLGGLTLTTGVYTFSTSAQLTGTLTLDFQGDPDALFVFQIGSTLTTASNASVVIINGGAVPEGCEVYWQTGSSATLGTATTFIGNIIALTSITLTTGANILSGRALARIGSVTLDTNVVTIPECDTGTISGRKFNDLNGDGIMQPGEPGLQGLTVYIDANGNGVLDTGESSTTTDADGNYSFTGLPAGTYRIRQVLPDNIVLTTPNPDDIPLDEGEDVPDVNFGDFILITISGNKFLDVNGNGTRNVGDRGLQGWTIFIDTNGNGVLNVGEPRTVTDINGNYRFTGVGPGAFAVREVGRPGWVRMTNNPAMIFSRSGTNVTGVSFGNATTLNLFPPSKLNLIGRNLFAGVMARQINFVTNLYTNLLDRAPDRAGLTYYVRLLQAGFSFQRVATIFERNLR